MSTKRIGLEVTRVQRRLALCVFFSCVCCLTARGDPRVSGPGAGVGIGPDLPADLEGGAFNAGLRQASDFAWTQFIALNWFAVPQSSGVNKRGAPYRGEIAPRGNGTARPVWETFWAKTELFPGSGEPKGFDRAQTSDDAADEPPLYRYDPAVVGRYPGLEPGLVPACFEHELTKEPPWIELSESHEVGPEKMYAGIAPSEEALDDASDRRIRYAVKVNRDFYRYVAEKGWLGGGNPNSTIPAGATHEYVNSRFRSPPAGSTDLVSFPNGSIQIKTAWRRLSEKEKSSGRFHTAIARSYQPQDPSRHYHGRKGNPTLPCYLDAEWGLVGMHIKTKTPSAPYYIWSTFEHVDNIRDQAGKAVEDEDGRLIRNADQSSTDPTIRSRNAVAADPATPETIQSMLPASASAHPGKRLYYTNKTDTPTTQGTIAVNRRDHPIPEPVIASNHAAHQAIRKYLDEHEQSDRLIDGSLIHYKLISVQWRPADKPVPGEDLRADPAAPDEVLRYPLVYYMANIVLETSYRLQNYSGVVQFPLSSPYESMGVQDLITDFDRQAEPVRNVMYDARKPNGKIPGYNMGGCMGCHGQMQITGYDFSFIFRRGRVDAPEMSDPIRTSLADMVHGRNSNE
ncbi:MAG: hypothetical protein LJE70_20185 [Chromatiaceae bacterium]|nr:hypothetical protein [Chromatiaceae bacterium]